jgi:hypothetical protein
MTALIVQQYTSVDLAEVWRSSYRKAMGISDVRASKPKRTSSIRITNLMRCHRDHEEDTEIFPDKWMNTALEIQKNIEEMARWIRQKRPEYCGVHMSDTEASLIQSTIMAFTATTATEIESLRGLIDPRQSEQRTHHQTSIVQILLGRLKEEIAEPFGKMQKLRTRAAVRLWQHPLECKLFDSSHRFSPKRPPHKLQFDFLSAYEDDEVIVDKPKTGIVFGSQPARRREKGNTADRASEDTDTLSFSKNVRFDIDQQQNTKMPYQQDHDSQVQLEDPYVTSASAVSHELQQEALLLTASLQGELDSVQQMEHMMVDITTLLSQFAELVAEQQEDVFEIRDASASAKQNVESGEEELLKARERTDQSSHYMAKGIFGMALLLLFFNWIRD